MMLTDEQLKMADNILSTIKKHGFLDQVYLTNLPKGDFIIAFLEDELKLIASKEIPERGDAFVPPELAYRLTWNGFNAQSIGLEKYIVDLNENNNLEIKDLKQRVKVGKRALLRAHIAIAISILALFIGPSLNKFIDGIKYVENESENSNHNCNVRKQEFIIEEGDTIAVLNR